MEKKLPHLYQKLLSMMVEYDRQCTKNILGKSDVKKYIASRMRVNSQDLKITMSELQQKGKIKIGKRRIRLL